MHENDVVVRDVTELLSLVCILIVAPSTPLRDILDASFSEDDTQQDSF